MKKQCLLLFCLMSLIGIPVLVYAQENPPGIHYFYLYSMSGQEYFGRFWPENTNIQEAIAMDQKAKSENSSNMRLFEGCDLKLRVLLNKPVPKDTVIYLKLEFLSVPDGFLNIRAVVSLPDSIPIPSGVTYFEYPYSISHLSDAENGKIAHIKGYTTRPNGSVYSGFDDRVNFFSKFTYNIQFQEEYGPSRNGYFRLNVKESSPQIVCSFDGGYTWKSALLNEYSQSDLNKAIACGYIYIKEPNSCICETIPISSREPEGLGSVIVNRAVWIEAEEGISTFPHAGMTHYTPSWKDFTFKVYGQPEKELVVTTNRQYDNDGGVKINPTGEGEWDVTIVKVHSSINIRVGYKSATESENGTGNTTWTSDKVWTSGGKLYVKNTNPGILSIYMITGQLYKHVEISGDYSEMLPKGSYFVRLNGKTYKIIL